MSLSVRSENKNMIMTLDSIPTELIMEILLRLPTKSIARFHCVSKRWASILSLPYFTELFLTRSSVQPRILFAIEKKGLWSIFSVPQNQSSSSSLVVAAEFHMKFPPGNMRIYRGHRQFSCGYASGLIYFYGVWIGEEDCIKVPVICNPKTGRYATLPYLRRYRKAYSFFGFDPIDKQFKVLFMAYPSGPDSHKIMTLGTGEMRWRRIKCSLRHEIVSEGICINGVLYYLGDTSGWGNGKKSGCVIVCFDVRSETFKWIYLESFCELINYKGKLGVIYLEDDDVDSKEDEVDANAIGLRVWVLEDLEKDEWSKYEYTLRDDKFISDDVSLVVVGVTATGEIILSMRRYVLEEPFYVFYFNPETKTLQSVEIKGFGAIDGAIDEGFASLSVYPFVNHVEDLNVNDAKLLKQSIYAPYVNTEVKQRVYCEWSESEEEEEEPEGEKMKLE